jgi:hypothetical protein
LDLVVDFIHLYVFTDLGADPGFQVRVGALKKNAPSRGRRENFWGYFVRKITILRQKILFFNFRGGARNFWGISCEKSRFYANKIIFFQFSMKDKKIALKIPKS